MVFSNYTHHPCRALALLLSSCHRLPALIFSRYIHIIFCLWEKRQHDRPTFIRQRRLLSAVCLWLTSLARFGFWLLLIEGRKDPSPVRVCPTPLLPCHNGVKYFLKEHIHCGPSMMFLEKNPWKDPWKTLGKSLEKTLGGLYSFRGFYLLDR